MNQSREAIESEDERKLRELLVDPAADTSRAHDDSVLHAARAVAAELRADAEKRAAASTSADKPGGWRRRSRWNIPLSIAAALVLAIGIYWATGYRGPADSLRGGDSTAIAPRSGAELANAPGEFQWHAVPGAESYRVTLRDAEAQIVWQSPVVHEAHVTTDAGPLRAGGVYLWSVDVKGRGLDQQLGPYSFRLRQD